LKFQIVVVGKKTWKPQLKYFLSPNKKNISVLFKRKTVDSGIVFQFYRRSKTILDLMRCGQTGLSFRVFEAMALEKKIITNNPTIKDYDFYNPENILLLNDDFTNMDPEFLTSPYVKIPDEIYHKYTLESWVERVFNLK
jgi:hypothetical protein